MAGMARQVRHDEQGPEVFDKSDLGDDGKLYICRCGLSSKGALCDGSHNVTSDEGEDVYKYEDDDPGGQRQVIEGFEFDEE
jgi:CDGSH-type Zn-finger protein